ncbi:MAG: LysR family transcriptional regulator [Thermomicrobiales bacterium]|nr:LysR family transcriptional regulator [Thermomicrobiales bacterium]
MEITNLTPLRIFTDVIATGSFTAAAEIHGVTQPAVSFHVRQLEQSVGTTLIAREGKRAIATAAGVELLHHIARIEHEVQATIRDMAQFTAQESTQLRIGTGSTACATLLPGVLRLVRRSLPRTHLAVVTGTSPEITRKLVANDLDIGVITLPVRDRALISTPLFDDEIVLLAPATMMLLDEITPQSLQDHPSVMFESAHITRGLIADWFADAGLTFYPAMTVANLEALRELVALGMGYAILSRLALPQGTLSGDLVVRSLSPRLSRTIGLVTRRNQPGNHAAEIFIAALRQEIQKRGA